MLHSPAPPRTLLIEEPENGIHPENLGQLVELLRQVTEGALGPLPVQVILTTHSPYLLDQVRPDEVQVVTRDATSGTRVAPMASVPGIEASLAEFKLGELWTAIGDRHIG